VTGQRFVCVFCGSAVGGRDSYQMAARELARTMADKGYGLIYGGASVGLMGVLADAMLAAGGAVIGVIPKFLVEHEIAHPNLTELRLVDTMHERKAIMADLASAFIALPGGIGMLDETAEIYTWASLGLHDKRLGLLNVDRYFDPLLGFLEQSVNEGFLPADRLEWLEVDDDCASLIEKVSLPAALPFPIQIEGGDEQR
jgi:uncharacterized protein (TIGR00730 family)